jgi:hypothetical protein
MLRSIVLAATLATAALPAVAAEKAPYQLPKGSTIIPCTGTPFGKRLMLGIDQEVVVTRRQNSGAPNNSPLVNYQFSGALGTTVERQLALAGLDANFGVETTRVDLDGDGRQELATAVLQPGGSVAITIVRPGTAAGTNTLTPAWVRSAPPGETFATAIDLASGDLDGSADGKEELVLAVRYGSGTGVVYALNGTTTGGGAIAQANNVTIASWTMPEPETRDTEQLQIAVGDVLLEGRDQVVLLNVFRNTSYRFTVLRFEDVDSPAPGTRFNHQSFTQSHPNGGEQPARLTLHIGDFGGSAAEEMLVHHLVQDSNGALQSIVQTVRYFTTSRAPNNAIENASIQPITSSALRNVVSASDTLFAAAIGEIDRRPDQEIVLARTTSGTPQLNVQVFKLGYDAAGFPISIDPAAGFVPALAPLSNDTPTQIEIAVGDADADGIGDAYVAIRDGATAAGPNITKLRRFGLARPTNPNGLPLPGTFALRGSFDFPNTFADTRSLRIDVADWDRDSVLADIGSTCREVREPMLRTVVRHPPFWSRLQGSTCCFEATIGQTRTDGTGLDSRYDTFTSQDISGYVGVSVGGEILGIGAQATAKATAGYAYEARRGERRTTEISNTVSQSQTQASGGGLVVLEENTHRCYDYNVSRNGVASADSNVRACEVIRRDGSGNALRSIVASDPTTWDTTIAGAGGPGGIPSQWVPINPEWASLALFRVPTAHPVSAGQSQLSRLTDGQYGTFASIPFVAQPYYDLDLGAVRDVTNIRLFPKAGGSQMLVGVNVYLSETPITGTGLPTGPGVRAFVPDLVTDNGVDRWNIWTRAATTPHAAARARYVRVQQALPGNRALEIAELQVFGDVQNEPPAYPVNVCDDTPGNGTFRALVFDGVEPNLAYRTIDMRGDLLWTGFPALPTCGTNHSAVDVFAIWDQVSIGGVSGSGSNAWDMSNNVFNGQDDILSISHSTRVGAEVELEAGAVVQAVVGGAFEWAAGATEEESTSVFWSQGINYRGVVPGFSGANLGPCQYRSQPFAYVTSDRANIGYEHQYTVIDYVVPNFNFDRLSNPPPAQCFPASTVTPPAADPVFANGFE